VNIQLNIVTCPTYPDKFIRDMLLHRLYYLRQWRKSDGKFGGTTLLMVQNLKV